MRVRKEETIAAGRIIRQEEGPPGNRKSGRG